MGNQLDANQTIASVQWMSIDQARNSVLRARTGFAYFIYGEILYHIVLL